MLEFRRGLQQSKGVRESKREKSMEEEIETHTKDKKTKGSVTQRRMKMREKERECHNLIHIGG